MAAAGQAPGGATGRAIAAPGRLPRPSRRPAVAALAASLLALAAPGCTGDAGVPFRASPAPAAVAATARAASASAGMGMGPSAGTGMKAGTGTGAGREAAAPAAPPHVLLVAVGDEQPVFDRFVGDLARRFAALDVASLATASSSGKVGRRIDRPADLYAAIRGMRGGAGTEAGSIGGEVGKGVGGAGGGCLVYLTGHGARVGMSMPLGAASTPPQSPARRYAAVRPEALAQALREGCGDAPTVVVTSACYSGVYLGRWRGAAMRAPGRIVLTAAAPDRTSFGCADDETHTYYDGCFLQSFDAASADTAAAAPTWRDVAARTTACVAERERKLLPGAPPSMPQSFFGRDVAGLPLPRSR